MSEEEAEWIGFTGDSIESLPPEQQELARRAMAEYKQKEPLAEVTVRVFELRLGGSELRWRFQDPPNGIERNEWYPRVGEIVAAEVKRLAKTLGQRGEPRT